MAFWGLSLMVVLLINGPLPPPPDDKQAAVDEGQMKRQAVLEAPQRAEGAEEKEGQGNAFGLVLFVFQSMFLRHWQRVLFESGIIYVLEEYYGWTPEEAGFVMTPVMLYCLMLEVLFAMVLQGKFSDKSLLFMLELKQLLGCALMLFGAARPSGKIPWCLLLGGMIIYGANALFGGIMKAYCTKRALPRGIASREGITLAGFIGGLLSVSFGGLASRVVLGASPSPQALALLILVVCCFQFITSSGTLELQKFRRPRCAPHIWTERLCEPSQPVTS